MNRLAGVIIVGLVVAVAHSARAEYAVFEYALTGRNVRTFDTTPSFFERVAVSPANEVYVSDATERDVKVFSLDGVPLRTLSTSRLSDSLPYGMGFDPAGDVLVGIEQHLGQLGTLQQSAGILKFDPSGHFVVEWQPAGPAIDEYDDIKVTPSGRIFASTAHGSTALGSSDPQIYEVNSSGAEINSFSDTGALRFHRFLALSPSGDRLFALSQRNGLPYDVQLREFQLSGNLLGAPQLTDPQGTPLVGYLSSGARVTGLQVDNSGDIWTYDNMENRLLKYNAAGTPLQSYPFALLHVQDFTFTPSGDILFITSVPEPGCAALLALAAMLVRSRRSPAFGERTAIRSGLRLEV